MTVAEPSLPAVQTEIPDGPTVAGVVENLRTSGVLGDTYADLALVINAEKMRDEDDAYDHYEMVGRFLAAAFDASRWWVADWLIFGEGAFGERAAQAAEALGLSPDTLTEYTRVALRVPRSRRRKELHFSHHRAVAALDPEPQALFLQRAVDEMLSSRELADVVRDWREEQAPPLPAAEVVPSEPEWKAIVRGLVRAATVRGRFATMKVEVEQFRRLQALVGEGE